MGARQTIGGRSSCVLYLGILGALALAVALVVIVFIVAPERERQQQAEAQRAEATATAAAITTEIQRAYDAGIAFAAAGDWDKAAEEFARVVALEPGYKDAAARLTEARASAVESAYQRGLRLLSLEQWEQAKAEFEQVIALNPNYKDVQANLAKAEARLAAARALTPTVASASRPTERLQPTAKVVAASTARAQAANWKEAARSAVVDYFESWKDKDYDAMFSLISNAMEYKIESAEELRQIYSNTRTALHFYSIGQGKFADDMTSGVFPVDFDIESASFPTMRATRNINVSKSGAAWVMDYWGLWKVVRPAESQSLSLYFAP